MGEVLGLGCSHAPMILNPAEQWPEIRRRIYGGVPNYEAPPKMVEELGDDNGASRDKVNQQKIVDAFAVLREKLTAWNPDLVIVVGDDQVENFKRENLPTFCLYTGNEVDGYPFHRPGGKINIWNESQDKKYSFKSPGDFSKEMVKFLIRAGFDMSSATELKGWDYGLPHAHINPLMFLNQDGAIPVLPLFVNCYGEEAGDGYPPRAHGQAVLRAGAGHRQIPGRAQRTGGDRSVVKLVPQLPNPPVQPVQVRRRLRPPHAGLVEGRERKQCGAVHPGGNPIVRGPRVFELDHHLGRGGRQAGGDRRDPGRPVPGVLQGVRHLGVDPRRG